MAAVYTKKRLGDLLLQTGLITRDQLNQALEVQKQTGERFKSERDRDFRR
ncbi:hypothetical protein Desku_1986 [Desulfofundulus kuznetsovii DSM 6115]|uniref:Type II secretion system protein E n=2 Tax=Desulfofundulus kuznetsovii TaxID=58135 RepID=A0AAU8PIL5_DESK7|nr:hypothetical protein Desku_1986 [Desulfofundulus kuznetsovii DSM 6115]